MKNLVLVLLILSAKHPYGQDIFQTVKSGDLPTLRRLVVSGENLNVSKGGYLLLYYAIISGNVDIVRYMEQKELPPILPCIWFGPYAVKNLPC